MKNILSIAVFTIIFTIWGAQHASAQYRQYSDCEIDGYLGIDDGDRLDLYNRQPTYRGSKCGKGDEISGYDEDRPFEFEIYYYDIGVLLQMQAAMAAAQRAAVEAWMRKQEDNFRKEINRQLATDHTSFRDAQKAFFENYEKGRWGGVEETANGIAASHNSKALRLDEEQQTFTTETHYLREWEEWRYNCRVRGIDCEHMPDRIVRGTHLGSTGTANLDYLRDGALKDFSEREYESAQNLSWSQGLYKIVDDGSLLSGMVDKHIAYYNQRGLEDKIFLMTTYLSLYYYTFSGTMPLPTSWNRLPNFWNNDTLLEMGKKNAPKLSDPQRVFKKNFFENEGERCNYKRTSLLQTICFGNLNRLEKLKEQVIQEHIDGMGFDEEIIRDESFQDIDKINCTYDQLEKTETIKKLLKDFFGDDAEFDLIFKVVEDLDCNDADDPNACTKVKYNNARASTYQKVEILIDKDYINSAQTPTIFLARTLLHEAVHANLFLAVKKLNGGATPPDGEFGTLYEEYRQKKNWQHEFMADRYVGLIAQGLKEVHPLLGDAAFIADKNANFPDWDWDSFYTNQAWLGLDDTIKGKEYFQNNEDEISLYYHEAEANSTKTPKCDRP